MWQRMNAMVVLRQLAGNAQVIHFLFTTYDLKQVRPVLPCLRQSPVALVCLCNGPHRLGQPSHPAQQLLNSLPAVQESKLNAVTSMVETMAGIVEAFVLTPQDTVNTEAIQAVSGLYQQKSNSERVPFGAVPTTHACMLRILCLASDSVCAVCLQLGRSGCWTRTTPCWDLTWRLRTSACWPWTASWALSRPWRP